MIIHDVQQGTSEWLKLRAGIPTASQFDMIFTKSGGKSQSRERYLYTLLAERMMGEPIQDHVSMWMERGSSLEVEALNWYKFQRETDDIRPVGFITDDLGLYGCSPDNLVNDDGTLEIKIPKEWLHVGYLLQSGRAYQEHKVQVQGQLWITGREWVDVLSYHPKMFKKALHRVPRDDKFIEELSVAVRAFSIDLETIYEKIVAEGWLDAPAKPRPMSAAELMKAVLRESITQVMK